MPSLARRVISALKSRFAPIAPPKYTNLTDCLCTRPPAVTVNGTHPPPCSERHMILVLASETVSLHSLRTGTRSQGHRHRSLQSSPRSRCRARIVSAQDSPRRAGSPLYPPPPPSTAPTPPHLPPSPSAVGATLYAEHDGRVSGSAFPCHAQHPP